MDEEYSAPIHELGEREDPFNRINTARLRHGEIVELTVEELSDQAFSDQPFEEKNVEENEEEEEAEEGRPRPLDKIHPVLRQWLEERSGDETEELLINFADDLTIPRFPELPPGESRESEIHSRITERAGQLIRGIERRRAASYERQAAELTERHHVKVQERFWLVNAMLVEMPLNAVRALAEREDVIYIEPRHAGEEPPANDVAAGRDRIVSDPYFNLGLTGGFIGLLDTGVRFSHTEFTRPSHIDFRRDCVNGGANCNTGSGLNPNDDCWNHGTSSAAIITANSNQGNGFRGVTGITLDSWKVYPSTFSGGACTGGLDAAAAVRGFQAAVAAFDRVIVAEMQGSGDDLSTISVAADQAFDAGAVIIAANGNNGPAASTVNAPANAHRVIGVGNFDVQTQTQVASQSRGPAPDGRIKPDIQTPTNTQAASNASDTATQVFTGTSGATPYAAGAAALLRNWLRGTNPGIDPGQVYAQLILSGQQPYLFDNTSGAGHLRLPTDGWAWWGKVSISNGVTIDIPLGIQGGRANTFDGGLWWPESAVQSGRGRSGIHNDVDLYLVDPAGIARASSTSGPSVFERARVQGPVAQGVWRLRIRGYNVTGSQTVYWAAHVRLI